MHLRSKESWVVFRRNVSIFFARSVVWVVLGCVALVSCRSVKAEDGTKRTAWPEVSIDLIALDHKNDVVSNLAPQNVQVSENGVPQTVTSLNKEDLPASICVLVDVSGSMSNYAEEQRRIAWSFIQQANPQDEFCIVSFQWEGWLEQTFTKDRAQVMGALKGLKFGGGTASLDSIKAAADYMDQHASNSTRVLVVSTDGADNASKLSSSKLAQALKAKGYLLCVLAFAPAGDLDVYKGIGQTLRGPVESTGGLILYADGSAKMDVAIKQLDDAIRGRYRLSYTSTNADRDGRLRSLEVKPLKTAGSVKMSLHAQKGYYAPSQ
jgi:VWFA-related protein